MDPITRIENEIINGLSANEYQRLCASYLYAARKGSDNEIENLVDLGSQEGRNRTTKGTPDIYFITKNGGFIYVECTLVQDNIFTKLQNDIAKCLSHPKNHNILEIIIFYISSKLTSNQYKELAMMCEENKVKLTLIGIDKLAHDLYDHYPSLVKDFLHLSFEGADTGSGGEKEFLDYTKSLMNPRIQTMINSPGHMKSYVIDIVFCIDTTDSMGPILGTIRTNCYRLYMDLTTRCYEKGKAVKKLRIKVISFKDYLSDENPMTVSSFLSMPEEAGELVSLFNSLKPEGGGDEPESSLEAIGYAIKSNWSREEYVTKRQIIVVWTDAPAHMLEEARSAEKSPKWMARNLEELEEWWNDEKMIDQTAKRLLLFAPSSLPYTSMYKAWTQTLMYDVQGGEGMLEFEWDMVIDAISNSI